MRAVLDLTPLHLQMKRAVIKCAIILETQFSNQETKYTYYLKILQELEELDNLKDKMTPAVTNSLK